MATRAITGNMYRSRKLADMALAEGRTLRADILVAKHGGMETCKSIARGIQRSFAAMRAVDREREANKTVGAGLSNKELWVRSKYDKIACSIYALPEGEGWRVEFSIVEDLMDGLQLAFTDGTAPKQANREMDELLNLISVKIADVEPAQVIACALHFDTPLADIPNEFAGPMVAMQGPAAEAWMMEKFMPKWREAMAEAAASSSSSQQNNSPVTGQTT